MKTYNFRREPYAYTYPAPAQGAITDLRNGIVCINPSLNLECYLNYLELLDSLKDTWKGTGYLHLGMMPVVMAPSFFPRKFTSLICEKLDEKNVKYFSMPPVSLLYDNCRLADTDIWMFREDAAKMKGVSNIKAVDFLRWVI